MRRRTALSVALFGMRRPIVRIVLENCLFVELAPNLLAKLVWPVLVCYNCLAWRESPILQSIWWQTCWRRAASELSRS